MDGSCHITKNGINLDLIQIIQFCFKIYDLCRHPTDGLMGGVSENTKNNVIINSLRLCFSLCLSFIHYICAELRIVIFEA